MAKRKRNKNVSNRIIREPVAPETYVQIKIDPPNENNKWLSCFDPLQGLSIEQAKSIYDMSLAGNYVRISYLYDRIESAMPELMVCAERRSSALTELDWTIRNKDSRKRGYDEKLADEQNNMLAEQFANLEDSNLWALTEHLSSAFFRGFAVGIPEFSNGGKDIESVELINNWNIARNIMTGEWYYNPDCVETTDCDILTHLPINQIITLSRPRHIDYPALMIAIRSSMGETMYGQMLSRYGIPPVLITMPDKMSKDKMAQFANSARDLYSGGSGALPYGSTVQWATAPAGVAPFEAFLAYQKQQIVLMATGGLATSLDMAQGLGSGTSDAHKNTWDTIVSRDSALVANSINRAISTPLLNANFPGKPHLASFDFETEIPLSASDIFDVAIKAKNAGLLVDIEQMEQKTGYTLTRDTSPTYPTNPTYNKVNNSTEPAESKDIEKDIEKDIKEAIVKERATLAEKIVEALQSDNPSAHAKALLDELDIDNQSYTAEALEELYATKFVKGVE